MQDLVILTGHSSGLGQALLEQLLVKDVLLIAIARRSSQLTAENLVEINYDLSGSLENLLGQLHDFMEAKLGSLRSLTLINNAGSIEPVDQLGQLDSLAIERSIHLNVTAPLQLINFFAAYGSKLPLRLIQISSGAAHKAYPGWSVYCGSKAALRISAQVLAEECKRKGADFKLIIYEPGVLDTPMQAHLRQLDAAQFPAVERFQGLHKRAELVAPADAARELLCLWQDPSLPNFIETRFAAKAAGSN
ncbi:MAG: SDR family NAD(P)-dependent oxidoreductase [Proteobacteria bacterium]|nr:SDR family NAD(P)-dependent oxidoreductase [Pseudomonadota bacterium]